MFRSFFVYALDMDMYTFSPANVGLAALWKCDLCHSLLAPGEESVPGHIKWHEELRKSIHRASIGF